MTGIHYPNLSLILPLLMNLKCCWTDTIVIIAIYLIMYNIIAYPLGPYPINQIKTMNNIQQIQ